MNWKEMLMNIGTPVVETLIAEEIGDVVIFQRNSSGEFIVIESSGLMPKKAVYTSEEEILKEFDDYKLCKVTSSIYYLLKEVPDNFNDYMAVEKLSERVKSIERLENRITRHIYQLEGLDTIIVSLMEPMPMEITMSMMADAISELFVTSVGMYRLKDDAYKLLLNVGLEDFPVELPSKDLKDATKIRGALSAEDFIKGEKGLIVPIKEKRENKYLVFLKKNEPFAPEERSLINAIFRILEISREYLKSEEELAKLDLLLSQTRFVIESLGEFTKRALSIHDKEAFESIIVDMIREMLQLQWTALYKKSGDQYSLSKYSSVVKRDFPNTVEELKDIYQKSIIKVDEKQYIFVMGKPLSEEVFPEEIKDLYLEITMQILEEAFKNMDYQDKIVRSEKKIQNLLSLLNSIEELLESLKDAKTPGEIYERIYDYLREKHGIKGIKVAFRGMEFNYGETEGKANVVIPMEIGSGSMAFYKEGQFSNEEKQMLKSLVKGAEVLLTKLYLFLPGERYFEVDETVLRFLREKASVEGLDMDNLKYYNIKSAVDINELKNLGIGIITNKGIIFATDKEEELKKLGIEYEEF